MNYEELTELLTERGNTDAVVFAPPFSYSEAVIGITDEGRVVYSYDKMVKCLTDEGMDYSEAEEFIEYNTLSSIPYMDEMAPIVVFSLD